ncbi:MAG: multicopper oxidase domain-containing protein [Planctomycetota bacterium]|jgi:spore coat protein A
MQISDRRIWLLAVLAATLLVSGAAQGDLVTIQASKDNTLYEDAAGSLSNGAGVRLFSGNTSDKGVRRALMAFDVAGSVPAGSTIDAVTLTLNMGRSQRAGAETFTLYRMDSDWGEGTSVAAGQEGGGGPATTGDATWIHSFYASSFWTTAGGDFSATASASLLVDRKAFYTWGSTPEMVADVQGWLNVPANNFGWILIGNEAAIETAKRFDSRENGTAANRPVLEVTFTPAAPTGACCAADGNCSVVLDPGASCVGTYQGVDTVCDPNPCPLPVGACCLPTADAQCTEVDEPSCTGQGGTYQGALSLCSAVQCPVVLEHFVDALPLPAVAQPVSGAAGGAASYEMAMREIQQQLHRDLLPTTVWGYDDGAGPGYPGRTIEASVGQPVTVTWINDLRDTSAGGSPPPLRTSHYLPVDTCPHGATENQDARVVVHLHGGHLEAASDGYPESTFPPGQQVVYEYPNWQLPSTLWYHDHALGITRLNVIMGLAGFYLIRDAYEQSLGLPSGEFEIPLAIQDRTFNPDGSFQYPAIWQDLFFGDTVLVNGKVWPFLNVKQGKYRFRMLNGSTSRTYTLTLSTGAPFHQIGAEGGLLPAPVSVNQITLGPGERADVVVDFALHAAGTEIILTNSAPSPFPGDPGVGVIPDVMKFVVTADAGHTDPLPGALRPMQVLQEGDASIFREFHLEKGPGNACSPFEWEIRSIVGGAVVGSKWVDVTELPELEDTEVWKFVNRSGMTHPMHLHLVMFQVLDRQGFDEIGGEVVPIGSPVPPPPQEAGWKDTVQVGPNEIVRVIAHFENYTGRYSYHCHILEHEDHEMMRQFETVATTPACQDGADNDNDGLTDHAGGDPGCDSPSDLGEHAVALPCDDGLDNDGDGLPDYPADPGCAAADSTTESPECNDGIDNDGDGGTDYDGSPPDPECGSVASHFDEAIPVPEPGGLLMLAAGVTFLATIGRRRAG